MQMPPVIKGVITGESIAEVEKKLKEIEAKSSIESNISENADKQQDELVMLSAMDGDWEIAGIKLKQPSFCVLMLLYQVDCPFLRANQGIKPQELVETLFILHKGKDAVKYLLKPKRKLDALARCEKLAEKSVEFYAEYLKAVARESGVEEYDLALAEFAESLGVIDVGLVAAEVDRFLQICQTGLEMLPQEEGAEGKKNTDDKEDGKRHKFNFKRD
jgi:hypothetical protein